MTSPSATGAPRLTYEEPCPKLRLNVYVSPAGFYDAVVAAANQKAALAAWGVHANLFADGVAGPEEDPAWREKALASPGE